MWYDLWNFLLNFGISVLTSLKVIYDQHCINACQVTLQTKFEELITSKSPTQWFCKKKQQPMDKHLNYSWNAHIETVK